MSDEYGRRYIEICQAVNASVETDWPARCRDLEIRLHNTEAAAKRYKLQLETLRAAVREAADKST